MSISEQVRMVEFRNFSGGVASANGHYSHLVELPNGVVQLCGIKAWDPTTGALMGHTISDQVEIIFDGVTSILQQAGMDVESITRISCHLASASDYDEFNAAYSRRLGSHKPVRTVLAGYQLRGGALVELVVDAFRAEID